MGRYIPASELIAYGVDCIPVDAPIFTDRYGDVCTLITQRWRNIDQAAVWFNAALTTGSVLLYALEPSPKQLKELASRYSGDALDWIRHRFVKKHVLYEIAKVAMRSNETEFRLT